MFCPTLRVTFLRGPSALCVDNSVKDCVSADADSNIYGLNHPQPYGAERFTQSQHIFAICSKLFYVAKDFGPKQM